MTKKQIPLVAGCLLSVLYLVFFWKNLLIKGQFPINSDNFHLYYPCWAIGKQNLKGLFFLWDSYRNMGQPFLANPHNQALYPIRIFSLFGNYIDYLRIYVVFHSLWAGIFGFLLGRGKDQDDLRGIFCALGMGFSGVLAARVNYVTHFAAAAWVPCIIFLFIRRRMALLAFALALQWLGGFPPFSILTGVLLMCLAASEKESRASLLFFLKSAGLAAGLTCVQWFPFLQLLHESSRPLLYNQAEALKISALPIFQLKQLFLPAFKLFQDRSDYHFLSIFYLGPVFTLLFVWGIWKGGRREKILGIVGVTALVLSLGAHLGFYSWLPMITIFRFPANWILIWWAVCVILAVRGFQSLEHRGLQWAAVILVAIDFLAITPSLPVVWGSGESFSAPPFLLKGLSLEEKNRIWFGLDFRDYPQFTVQDPQSLLFARATLVPSFGTTFGLKEASSPFNLVQRRSEAYNLKLRTKTPGDPMFEYAGIGPMVVLPSKRQADSLPRWTDLEVKRNPNPRPHAFMEQSPSVLIFRDVPGKIEAEVEGPGTFVFSESYSSGWRAKVDSKRAPINLYEDCLMTLELGPGSHQIEFHYFPMTFLVGLMVSLFTIASFGFITILQRKHA